MNYTLPTSLLTDRLLIRPARLDDLDSLLSLHADAEVTRHIPHVRWANRTDADVWYARLLERHEKQTAVQCVIVNRETANSAETVMGTAMLFNFDVGSGLAEIGYLLGRAYWGQGYAREAIAAFIDFAFFTLDLRRLEATVDVRNVASNRLLQRLGFVREGVLRERWLAAGELQDINLHALLKREWRR